MYAVIRDRGRQYRVEEGSVLLVDRRDDAKPGDEIRFAEVLCLGGGEPRIGTPAVKGAAVVATVVGEAKGPKLMVFKMRRRKNSRRRQGHRAKYTELRITRIEG